MSRIIISYWIDILRKGWIKTKNKIGISGMLLDFFLAFGGTFLYHYFNQDGSYGFGEIFLGFALFVGIILAVLFLHVFIEPAIQDSEQKEIISKNEISDLQVGIGEEYDFEKSGKIYLAFQSFYEDVDISEMYVQVEQFFVSKFDRKEYFEKIRKLGRSEIFMDSKYLGNTLKWIKGKSNAERITLKPNEYATVLFLDGTLHWDPLDFRRDGEKIDDPINIYWRVNGTYEVFINVYGKVSNETKYRIRKFVVLVDFVLGKRMEIINSIVATTYLNGLVSR